MNHNFQFRDPLARVRGLGSAKSGVSHWRWQRLTALALVPLTIWFLLIFLHLVNSQFMGAIEIVGTPINSALLILYTIALFWHTQLGLQVVIEDYVHTRWLETTLQIVVKFLCIFLAMASIIAILRISFINI